LGEFSNLSENGRPFFCPDSETSWAIPAKSKQQLWQIKVARCCFFFLPVFLPHRRFVTEAHIDFPFEISGTGIL
jgi:hypothetical protein